MVLDIQGMHCAACAQTIEKALNKHEGIENASVKLATEKAVVIYDVDKLDSQIFFLAIKKI